MAFSRDALKELGIEQDKIENIMSLHGKHVQELKDNAENAKAKQREAQQEVKLYKKRIDEQSSELDDLKQKVNSGENLNEQVEALKQANKDKDEAHKKEMNKVKLQYEIDKELNSSGAKNNTAVMALINSESISLDEENGGVKGLREQLEELKQSDDYLFKPTENDDKSQNKSQEQQGQNDIRYNAGSSKGNNGGQKDESAIGREHAERLFGNKNKKEE